MIRLPEDVRHVRCDNPGPMTLTGTNSYVVRTAGAGAGREALDVVIIDPGPALHPRHERHLRSLVEAVGDMAQAGGVGVLLTHHHDDHQGGVADVVAALRGIGSEPSVYGAGHAPFPASLGRLEVVRTPGHTEDSVSFLFDDGAERVLFSGDTVLGGSSSFIAHPDGNLTAYLASLEVLARTLSQRGRTMLAPGHGGIGDDAERVVREYIEHRRERLDQVRGVLDELGPGAGVDDVIAAVYADIDPVLRPAVEAVVRAQIEHLRG